MGGGSARGRVAERKDGRRVTSTSGDARKDGILIRVVASNSFRDLNPLQLPLPRRRLQHTRRPSLQHFP